jgi:hypothetical protein
VAGSCAGAAEPLGAVVCAIATEPKSSAEAAPATTIFRFIVISMVCFDRCETELGDLCSSDLHKLIRTLQVYKQAQSNCQAKEHQT